MMRKKTVSYIITGCIMASSMTFYGTLASSEVLDNNINTYAAAKISISKPMEKVKPAAKPAADEDMSAVAVFAVAPGVSPAAETISPTVIPEPGSTPAPAQTHTAAQPQITPTPTPLPSPSPVITSAPKPLEDECLWYRQKLPMKKEHQKLLWYYCQERKLDYIDMLALISTESNFNEKASCGRYKGYFQISTSNAANLSKTLKTENKPLDGAININWGTAMYSWILADKRCKGTEDVKKKRDIALSIYSRGTGGYDKNGLNSSFLKRYYKMRSNVCVLFEK